MEQDTEITKVIFRRYRSGHKEILALFPEEYENQGLCLSYQHIGQHGSADYTHCLAITKPASITEPDVRALYDELIDRGYNLRIIKRYTRK